MLGQPNAIAHHEIPRRYTVIETGVCSYTRNDRQGKEMTSFSVGSGSSGFSGGIAYSSQLDDRVADKDSIGTLVALGILE